MYIKVYVIPDAKKESVEEKDGYLYISVKEPARANLANTRVIELVARHYAVPSNKVKILTGHHSRGKMLVVTS